MDYLDILVTIFVVIGVFLNIFLKSSKKKDETPIEFEESSWNDIDYENDMPYYEQKQGSDTDLSPPSFMGNRLIFNEQLDGSTNSSVTIMDYEPEDYDSADELAEVMQVRKTNENITPLKFNLRDAVLYSEILKPKF